MRGSRYFPLKHIQTLLELLRNNPICLEDKDDLTLIPLPIASLNAFHKAGISTMGQMRKLKPEDYLKLYRLEKDSSQLLIQLPNYTNSLLTKQENFDHIMTIQLGCMSLRDRYIL